MDFNDPTFPGYGAMEVETLRRMALPSQMILPPLPTREEELEYSEEEED